jgi:heme/copper-type cytochrome/quinol oxidase subunit 2
MRRLLPPLIFLLPGCTFYSWGNSVTPRSAAELKDVSPAVYIVLAVFCLILVACVAAMLFRKSACNGHGRPAADNVLAFFLAALSAAVILLLVG